jgi:LysR family hydrogen peroxide-inducible transcriptional activator
VVELDQLRYFLRIAELGNFTRAAEDLAISQPALSRSIQRLEEELGMPVFVRKARTLELTDAGQLLRSRAQQIQSIVEDTKAEICDDGQSGRLRIGAIPTIAPYFLPAFLQQFSQRYPQASLIIYEETTEALLKACSQGEVDVAIIALPLEAKYLQYETLLEEELWLVLPTQHPLLEKKRLRLEDVRDWPFIMLNEAHCLSSNIVSFCKRRQFQPTVVGKTSQLSMVQELVSLGHGVSLIPHMARQLDTSPCRVYRSLSGDKPKREIALAWDPYRFQTRMLHTLRQHLKEFVS